MKNNLVAAGAVTWKYGPLVLLTTSTILTAIDLFKKDK